MPRLLHRNASLTPLSPCVPRPQLLGNKWLAHASYPLPVFEAAGGVLRPAPDEHHLVVAGGYLAATGLEATSEVHALQVTKQGADWKRLADMPRALTHCAQVMVRDLLYLCGGFLRKAPGQSVSDCYVFSFNNNEWTSLPSLPVSVGGGAMVHIKALNALFYAGGMTREEGRYDGSDLPHTFMLSLNNTSHGWKRKANMPNPRNHMAAAVTASRYLFLGGQHSADEEEGNQATVNEYEYWNDKWISKASMPEPLGHIVGSTFAYWNGLIVVGGVVNGRKQSPYVYYYDVRSDGWTLVGEFARSVQSPICGLSYLRIHCSTGLGKPGPAGLSHFRKLSVPLPVQ